MRTLLLLSLQALSLPAWIGGGTPARRELVPEPAAGAPAAPQPEALEGPELLRRGLVAQAEAWFWRALQDCPWHDAGYALGVVDCKRRTGRLLELDRRIAELRAEWIASRSPWSETVHGALIAARALDRARAGGDLDLLWSILARTDVPPDALDPALLVALPPGDADACERLVLEIGSFYLALRDAALRQAALDALLSHPESARERALAELERGSTAAEVVLASLHDERVRAPLVRELLAVPPSSAFGPLLGWRCLLLAVEGSCDSYDVLEREAEGDGGRARAARTVLALLPRSAPPRPFSFAVRLRLEHALEEAGLWFPTCGRGRF